MYRILDDFPTSAELDTIERVIRRLQLRSRMPVLDADIILALPVNYPWTRFQNAVRLLDLRGKGLDRPSYGLLSARATNRGSGEEWSRIGEGHPKTQGCGSKTGRCDGYLPHS